MKISFEGTKKENPTYDGGIKVPYATGKRLISSWRWYFVVFITAAPLIVFLAKITLSYLFNSAPGMISMKMIDLNSPESAYISKMHVHRGDEIKKGGLLAELYDPDIEDRISFLNAEMESLKSEKNVAVSSSRLETNLKLAQKILSLQAKNLEQIKYLFSRGAATSAELNLAMSQYNQAELEVSRSKADLEISGTTRIDKNTQTRIDIIKKEIETNKAKAERYKIISPFEGTISDVYVAENQVISKGSKIARISIPGEYSIKAYLDPSKLSRAKKGKSVTIRLPGPTYMKGYVATDLRDAQKIPSEISESFYESRQAIEVIIIADQPVPQKFQIDGLPIKIFFGFLFF